MLVAIGLAVSLAWPGVGDCMRQEDVLSAEARAEYQRGRAELLAKRWAPAIAHFRQARAGRRTYPPLLRDLGLAYAGAGHDALAIAWLQAYLVADPRAVDAPTMRDEMKRLEAAAHTNVRDRLRQAVLRADALPAGAATDRELAAVAELTARSGDVAGALDIARRTRVEPIDEPRVWAWYAEGLAVEGEAARVRSVLAQHVSEPRQRDEVFHILATYFMQREGNAQAAREVAGEIEQPARRTGLIGFIDREARAASLPARSRATVSGVALTAEVLSAQGDARGATWRAVPKEYAASPRALAEQAAELAEVLRELRIQARRIACCLAP